MSTPLNTAPAARDCTPYPFTGLPNTRDLGNIATVDGRAIRPHCLIRSGALDRCTPHDRELLLGEYQLRTVIDLRTPMEQDQEPYDHSLFPGVNFISNPALGMAAVGVSHEHISGLRKTLLALRLLQQPEQLMTSLYPKLLMEEASLNAYRRFFDILLEPHEGAILWHCTMGKDRVGIAAMLLMFCLGVPFETIEAEYLASNTYLAMYGPQENQLTLKAYHLPSFAYDLIARVNTVHAEYLICGLDQVLDEYGSLDAYLSQALDMPAERRRQLQKRYLYQPAPREGNADPRPREARVSSTSPWAQPN